MKPPKSLEQFAKLHGLQVRRVKYRIVGRWLTGWDLVNGKNYIQLSIEPLNRKKTKMHPEKWILLDERKDSHLVYLRTIREILKYEFTPAEKTCMKWNDDFSI